MVSEDEVGNGHNLSDRYENGSFKPNLPPTESRLMAGVDAFFYSYHLGSVVDLNLLKRGALLAQNRGNLQPPLSLDCELASDDSDEDSRSMPQHRKTAAVTLAAASNDQLQDRHQLLLTDSHRHLTHREFQALKDEIESHIGSLTKGQMFVLATCALGATLQGSSQESLVGANIEWPKALRIVKQLTHDLSIFEEHGLLYFSLVNAIPWFAAAIVGSWVSDPLSSHFGRRVTLFLAGLSSLAAPIGGAYSKAWWHLLICRLIQGFGMGAKSSVIPVLISEISPPRMRGRLLVSWQTFVAIGIALGASINLIFSFNWRLQFGMSFIPSVPFIFGCLFLTESPHWLVKSEQYPRAYRALRDLRPTELQAARDLYLLYFQVKIDNLFYSMRFVDEKLLERMFEEPTSESFAIKKSFLFQKYLKLFSIGRNRRALTASCTVMTAQQLSGLNIFAFLVTSVLSASGWNSNKSLYFGLGFGLANAAFSALVYFFIDRVGRRNLLLSSQLFMTPLIFLTGYFLNKEATSSTHSDQAAIVVLVMLYVVIYSWGAGVIPFMYSSEVFSTIYREAGMSLSCMVNFALAGTLLIVIPSYTFRHCGQSSTTPAQPSTTLFLGACRGPVSDSDPAHEAFSNLGKMLYVFGGLNMSAAFAVWLVMRTPDEPRSLHDMNFLFGAPIKDYARYQLLEVLPWILKLPLRVVRRSKTKNLPRFEDWRQAQLQMCSHTAGKELKDFSVSY